MGNCIIRQIKIMQMGQEVTKHKESMKVHQALGGQTCYPTPLHEAVTEVGDRVVRIKLMITKHELEVMLRKGFSADDLASYMQKVSSDEAVVIEEEDNRSFGRWKPVLDSIPE